MHLYVLDNFAPELPDTAIVLAIHQNAFNLYKRGLGLALPSTCVTVTSYLTALDCCFKRKEKGKLRYIGAQIPFKSEIFL